MGAFFLKQAKLGFLEIKRSVNGRIYLRGRQWRLKRQCRLRCLSRLVKFAVFVLEDVKAIKTALTSVHEDV